MILITNTFSKLVTKIKSVWLEDIKNEIYKHKSWINNFKEIWLIENRKVFKWYLLSKKVRIVVLFQENNWNYIPFYIARKESKDWYNISKYSLPDLILKLDNIYKDLESWEYKIIN